MNKNKSELELCGITHEEDFSGHALYAGKRIATFSMNLPSGFWEDATKPKQRGRPRGESEARIMRDIKTLAAYEIVEAALKRDAQEASIAEIFALVMGATRESGQDEYVTAVEFAKKNERQLRRRLEGARKSLIEYQTLVNVSENNPPDWYWCAVSQEGSAYLYFYGRDIIACRAEKGVKFGSIRLTPSSKQDRTK